MAEVAFDLAIAIGAQTASGEANIDAVVRDAAGSINAATHGLVLGDVDAGIGGKGIELELERVLAEKATLSNFTRQASDFIREGVPTLSIGFRLAGNRNVLSGSPAAAEFALDKGIDALLGGLGLAAADWSGGIGKIYTPATPKYLTVKLWAGGGAGQPCLAWAWYDCLAEGSIVWTPAGFGILTVELAVGALATSGFTEPTFPTLDYQEQGSQGAPVVRGVAHAWGATRGFTTFELTFANETESLADSNSVTGVRPRSTARNLDAAATLYADGVDLSYERDKLVAAGAPVDLMSFTVGSPVPSPAGGRANAYRVRLTTPEARKIKPVQLGDKLGWECELAAVSGSANGEFELILL
jgi:hypothetical protein